jgi:DNA invertase Pin-like site-specific DNA recombinase
MALTADALPEAPALRAAIYCRQSLAVAGDEDAVARQEKECRQLAARRGWPVRRVYVDNDTSASGSKPRPEFDKMLADARAGHFDVIVAWEWDRLTRTVRDYLPLAALGDVHGVKVCTVSGDIDMTTDAGQAFAGVATVFANLEVKRKAKRQMAANRQRAEAGEPHPGGPRAFGYEPGGMTLRQAEAEHVRAAYRSLLEGVTILGIARDLNDAGQTTARGGNPWTSAGVRQLLANPRNAGLRARNGDIVGPAKWPAIVDEDVWLAAQAVLADPARRTNRGTGERRWLLTALARCGVCEANGTTSTLVSNYQGRKGQMRRVYICRTGKHLVRAADQLDEFVADRVIVRLSQPDAADLLVDDSGPDGAALQVQAQALRERLEGLARSYAHGTITEHMLEVGSKEVRGLLTAVEGQLVDQGRLRVLKEFVEGDAAKVWNALPVVRRQAVVRTLMDVTVLRGKAGGNSRLKDRPLDQTTVRIDWRRQP